MQKRAPEIEIISYRKERREGEIVRGESFAIRTQQKTQQQWFVDHTTKSDNKEEMKEDSSRLPVLLAKRGALYKLFAPIYVSYCNFTRAKTTFL